MLKFGGPLPLLGYCFVPSPFLVCFMGTLEDGTLCAYCGINEAYYIPDGCVGPVCIFPDGVSCWDIQERHRWDGVFLLRVGSFSKLKCCRSAWWTIPALGVQGITDVLSGFLIHCLLSDAVSIVF